MTNEEKAVIDAARAFVNDSDRTGRDRLVALRMAVHVLNAQPATERKFWVNYHFNLLDGRGGEGSAFHAAPVVNRATLDAWKASVEADIRRESGSSASVVIRTWTELES